MRIFTGLPPLMILSYHFHRYESNMNATAVVTPHTLCYYIGNYIETRHDL